MAAGRVPKGVSAGGQFAAARRPEPGLSLARNEVADHTDIDRYFAGGVDDIVQAPWAGEGVYPSYYEGHWRALPVVPINPVGLYRTQKRLFKKHLQRAAAASEPDGGDIPWIVRHRGKDFVIDGHHRIAHAVHNGHDCVDVHVVDLDR